MESTEAGRKEAEDLGTLTKNTGASQCFQKENLKKQLELFAPCSCTKNSDFKYQFLTFFKVCHPTDES